MGFKDVLEQFKKELEELYWWLGCGIDLDKEEDRERVERDFDSLTLTLNVGWNREAYLWYMDESRDLAINVYRDRLTSDTHAILDGRVPSDWYGGPWGDFTSDEEKMVDFYELSMDEFLQSYSYLTEQEYLNTLIVLQREEV